MVKKAVFAVLLALMLAGSAFGKVRDFGEFTADVPYGWRAKMQDNGIFTLQANDGSKGVGLFAQALGGTTEEAALKMSGALRGTKPIYDKRAGVYRFMFRFDGLEWRMAVKGFEEAGRAVYITWTGAGVGRELERILSSVKAKTDSEANTELEEALSAIKAK